MMRVVGAGTTTEGRSGKGGSLTRCEWGGVGCVLAEAEVL